MTAAAWGLPLVRTIVLAGETDFAGFRRAARALLHAGVAPEAVQWQVGEAPSDEAARDDPQALPVDMPAAVVKLAAQAVLHADPERFALLYRFLWRLLREPGLRHDALDADRVRLERMAQAVRREIHKMHAFVRFRPLDDGHSGEPLHVAWFEPVHHVVEAAAPFFARRFATLRWAILTPECSVRWDGQRLAFGPGGERSQAPASDAGDRLWLTYYASIFNPSRLKLDTMQREMPRRYWANLPEATLIAPLAAQAAERSAGMVARGGRPATRTRPIAIARAPAPPPGGLDALSEATNRCRECPIGEHATQSVVGAGPLAARLMFVGEQPGDQEDLAGQPFVGPAGQLLDRAFAQLGWPREQVFVTNAVKHFKFELRGKRRIHKSPAQREAAACLHWLEDEIALVGPEALVALGATAARSLVGRQVAVMSERGQWLERADGRRVLVTLHPSALLRALPEEREAAYARWLDDLRLAAPFVEARAA